MEAINAKKIFFLFPDFLWEKKVSVCAVFRLSVVCMLSHQQVHEGRNRSAGRFAAHWHCNPQCVCARVESCLAEQCCWADLLCVLFVIPLPFPLPSPFCHLLILASPPPTEPPVPSL